jgi:hypothetical protein
MWPMNVMSIGEVNDEGVPLDTTLNMRLSRVCGLATWQRVSITLQGFGDLTENEKDELFENSIQACIQYLEELKQMRKKVALKIISHTRWSYMCKFVKIWRDQDTPFCKYKDVTKEHWAKFVESANQSSLPLRVSTCSGFDHRMSLTTTSATPIMPKNRGSGNKRMEDWPSKVLRIHTINSMDGWDHLCVLVLS